MPNAANSPRFQPQPRPSTNRPPLTSSIAAAMRAIVPVEQVVAEPDRVESELLRGLRHRPVLGPAHDALDLGQLDSDAQGAGHGGDCTGLRAITRLASSHGARLVLGAPPPAHGPA